MDAPGDDAAPVGGEAPSPSGGGGLAGALRRAKYELESVLGMREIPYRWLMALRDGKRQLLARTGTDIVIDGYPRSGNTFAVVAFQLAQGDAPVNIARHLHAPAQALWGVRRDVPTLVLARDPGDAALSLVIREEWMTLSQALRHYDRFYRTLLPHKDALVVADFAEVTGDFGAVIDRVNQRHGTRFTRFDHTDDNVRRCFAAIERMDMEDTGRARVGEATVARPSSARAQRKHALRDALDAPDVRAALAKARALHADFVS